MTADRSIHHWRDLAPRGARAVARSVALSTLAAARRIGGRDGGLLRRPRVQFLIMHHIFPDEESPFRRLLEQLSRDHTFISYSEAVRRAEAAGNQVDRPYLAISFDDGFKNCLRAAAIMQEFNAKACFFICPSIIGEPDRAKVAAFCGERLELPGAVEFMDWDDLESLRKAGHEIGGHTMTHPHLTRLSKSQLEDEVGGSHEAIRKRFGQANHFAWTFGNFSDCSADVVRTVYQSGFSTCASGVRGCHGPQRTDASLPLCIRRDLIVAGWPLSHSMYFLTRSSRTLTASSGDWPSEWAEKLRQSR